MDSKNFHVCWAWGDLVRRTCIILYKSIGKYTLKYKIINLYIGKIPENYIITPVYYIFYFI